MRHAVYDAFATLLAYPVQGFEGRFDQALDEIEAGAPDLAEHLTAMARLLARRDAVAVEELYTRTFDMNPACALEAGWHLYGEDYDRGAFLVQLREAMRRVGVEETGELPDHLSHVLRVLGRLEPVEAARLSRRQVLPAVEKILAAFGEASTPYRDIVEGVAALLRGAFGPADAVHASAFACPAPYEQADGGCVCPGMPPAEPE